MNFIAVNDYILVSNGLFEKNIVVLFFVGYFILGAAINELSNKIACLFFASVLLPLSFLFPLNGPDKGSYATFFECLNSVGDVFGTLNTIDSPIYYILMVIFKQGGASVDSFFCVQNIIVSFCLLFLTYKYRWGYYVSYWLFFTHLLVPFSVRAHLILLLIFAVRSRLIFRSIFSFFLVFVHPLIALTPVSYLFRSYFKGGRIVIVSLIAATAFFLSFSFFYSKFINYTQNSSTYADGYGLSLLYLTDFFELILFVFILKPKELVDKVFLSLPVLVGVFASFTPMLGRFAFPLDVIYVMMLIDHNATYKSKRIFYVLLAFVAMLKFIKNYLLLEYYVL